MGLITFVLSSLAFFTLPGLLIIGFSKNELNFWESISLGTVIGFVLFTLISYLLYFFQIHFLLLAIFLLIDVYFLKKNLTTLKKFKLQFHLTKKLILLWIIFIIGITGQMAIISPSGSTLDGDLLFWSANGHDGTWHIALAEEIQKGYPFQNPIFAGEKLVNYHFFSDITLSDFNKYFKISEIDLYFKFFPFLFSLLLGATAFILGQRFGGNFLSGVWSTIFVYFVGSWGYIVTWLRDRTIGGESIFWGTQIQSSSGNPPQIVSDFLLITFLIFFLLYLKNKSKINFSTCFLLASTMVLFKIYAALAILGSLTIVGLWQIIRDRKFDILGLSVLSGLVSAILYFPNASSSGSFLIWEPWWYIRTMVVVDSRLNWLDLELRRQTYLADHNYKRVLQLEVTAFLIFFFGNLGMRFVGIASFFKIILNSYKNYFNLTLVLIILISFIFPLLFLQKGVAGNTSQFFQYFILLFGILAATSISQLINKLKHGYLKITLTVFIIALAVPTQLGLINQFYSRPAFAKISNSEITALNFLKNNSPQNSVILTPPYNKDLDLHESTPNIWDWFDTAYVSALSARRTFFADYEQVDIMGYNYQDRLSFEQQIFKSTNPNEVASQLRNKGINYLYFPKLLAPKFLPDDNFKIVFQNDGAEIWQVNP